MAFEITSDTVVKILVRRGDESDRELTLFSNGELGYSQDINRLFIGDGYTLGGRPVSNVFHGFVEDINNYTVLAHPGDTVYSTYDKTMYAYDGVSEMWRTVAPSLNKFFEQIDGDWYIDNNNLAPILSFNALASDPNSLAGYTNKIDLNKTYLSLSAAYCSFYFGNINSRTVQNHLNATVNVTNRLQIHQETANPYQLQLHARSSADDGAAMIKLETQVVGDGSLYIKAPYEVSVYTDEQKVLEICDGNYVSVRYKDVLGNALSPNVDIHGFARLRQSAMIDKDLTITGNLSVYGEASYFETNVVTTSALSVINWNEDFVPLSIGQYSPTPNQGIAYFSGNPVNNEGRPVVAIKDGPFFGFNVNLNSNSENTANFVVSGDALFAYSIKEEDGFSVIAGDKGILLNSTTTLSGTIERTYDIAVSESHITRARNAQLVTNIDNGAAVSLKNPETNSDLISLEIHSGDDGRGLWILADGSNSGSYNGIIQERDTAVIAKGGVNDEASLVLGVLSEYPKGIRIDGPTGNVSIGTDDAQGYLLYANGPTYINDTLYTANKLTVVGGGASINGNVEVTGQIRATNDIVAYYTSDIRLKNNIKHLTSALNKIDQISGVEFDWDNSIPLSHTGHDVGVIAQEIETVLPEAVVERDDGYKAVRYEKIIPLLIEAIKELKKELVK